MARSSPLTSSIVSVKLSMESLDLNFLESFLHLLLCNSLHVQYCQIRFNFSVVWMMGQRHGKASCHVNVPCAFVLCCC